MKNLLVMHAKVPSASTLVLHLWSNFEVGVLSTIHELMTTLTLVMLFDDRYGLPVYWTRDDNTGVWHPTTDYPSNTLCSSQGVVTAVPACTAIAEAQSKATAAKDHGALLKTAVTVKVVSDVVSQVRNIIKLKAHEPLYLSLHTHG